jgi:hypothetical protein
MEPQAMAVMGAAPIAAFDEPSGRRQRSRRQRPHGCCRLMRAARPTPLELTAALERAACAHTGRRIAAEGGRGCGVSRSRGLGFALASERFSWHIPIVPIMDAAARRRQ